MMDTQVDRELLEKIADLVGKPVGAFNIRKDTGCDGRQSTEHIEITGKTDGKSGIDIRVKDGTVGETSSWAWSPESPPSSAAAAKPVSWADWRRKSRERSSSAPPPISAPFRPIRC